MVHSAFHIEPVLKKSNYKITALDSWGKKLIVGTEEGIVVILQEQEGGHLVEFEEIEVRRVTKSSISQLKVSVELGLILILTADTVQVNDLRTLDLKAQLLKTRGTSNFSLLYDPTRSLLCCAMKNRLALFRWDGDGFVDWREIKFADAIRCHAWCGDFLCVASGRKYVIVSLSSGTEKELFDSNTASPTIFCLPNNKELLLGRDNMNVFQDSQGRPSRKYGLKWPEPPTMIGYLFPYLIAALPKSVEVQLMETQTTVQTLSLRASHMLACNASMSVFVVANNCVYRLRPVTMSRQIDALLESQQLETCLALCDLCHQTDPNVASKCNAVYRSYGLMLFARSEYDKAMGLFLRCDSLDPRNVLFLFPELSDGFDAAQDFRTCSQEVKDSLKGHKLLRSQVSLIKYLKNVRKRSLPSSSPPSDPSPALLEAIDTALLKALVRAEPENVLGFLQGLNACRLEESERLLRDYDMFHELVALFHSHQEHRRALELLAEHGQGPQEEHPLHGVFPTVEYLQSLEEDKLPILLEFSRWVLRADPEQGLEIFIKSKIGRKMPIDTVLSHLKVFDEEVMHDKSRSDGGGGELRIRFLEHIIAQGEERSQYHNELALLYLDAVQRLKHAFTSRQAAQGLAGSRCGAGKEPGALGARRKNLLDLLETSRHYDAQKLLSKLPMVDLYEERALILSKLGRHEEALSIYAHRLGDMQLAQEYCMRHYSSATEGGGGGRDVYIDLLKVFLKPPDASAPMTMQALSLMSRHFERMDPAKALDILPAETSLRSLTPFFESVVRANSEQRKSLQIAQALLKADHLKVAEECLERRARRVVISSGKRCKASQKRIGTSAFMVYPNNVVVLLGEKTDPNVCPATGRNFKEQPWD